VLVRRAGPRRARELEILRRRVNSRWPRASTPSYQKRRHRLGLIETAGPKSSGVYTVDTAAYPYRLVTMDRRWIDESGMGKARRNRSSGASLITS